jgi:hypothetical protein
MSRWVSGFQLHGQWYEEAEKSEKIVSNRLLAMDYERKSR